MFEIREDQPTSGGGRPGPVALPGPETGSFLATVPGSAPSGLGAPAAPSIPEHRPPTLRLLLRYKWTVLLILVIGSALTVPPVWMLIRPKYRAEALIRINPVGQRHIYKTPESGVMPLYQQYLNTNVALIKSSTVLNNVLSGDVLKTSWYKAPKPFYRTTAKHPYDRLLEELKVGSSKGTELIVVSFEAEEPKDAETIVGAVVREYFRYVEGLSDVDANDLMRKLKNEEEDLSLTLQRLTRERRQIAEGFGSTSLEEIQTLHTKERIALEDSLAKIVRLSDLADWEIKWRQSRMEGGQAPTDGQNASGAEAASDPDRAREAAQFYPDPEWRRLYLDLQAKEDTLERARLSSMGEQHPTMLKLLAEYDSARSRLDAREQVLEDEGGAEALVLKAGTTELGPLAKIGDLEFFRQRAQQEARIIRDALKDQEKKAQDVGEAATSMFSKDQELRWATERFERVEQRIHELEFDMKSPDRIQLAAPAKAAGEPSSDRRPLYSAVLAALWLAIGAGVCYLRAATDSSLSEAGDVAATVRVPFLGQLPRFADGIDPLTSSSPMLQESIRMIRTALLERCQDPSGHSVLITSPNVGSGKTTFTMLLARSLSHLGKNVLIVDTDLRRASLSNRLGYSDTPGLVELLRNGAAPDEFIRSCSKVSADVITTGCGATVGDAELMAGAKFVQSLAAWRKAYDFVLLDAAPVLPVADARILAGQADGTIMAVRASHTRRAEAVEALAELSAAGAKLFGTILVGTDPRLGYYRGYDYGSLAKTPSEDQHDA